eukprot:TRINITY_DN12425_c0_g1_i2.p2 TRINITY_DN12425_c0_g1~~TRINITY_DN12425_c0_g1_i2.p2  ORF type:complete len:334 (+),score=73.01 TRINITY_DN12425_c0_g1_i2:1284-2285(+)
MSSFLTYVYGPPKPQAAGIQWYCEEARRKVQGLELAPTLFLGLVLLEFLMVAFVGVYELVRFSDHTLTVYYTILIMLTTVFLMASSLEAVFTENKLELVSVIFLSLILTLRVVSYFISQEEASTALLVGVIANSVLQLFLLILVRPVWQSFGWRAFNAVGADPELLRVFETFMQFSALVKQDIQFTATGALMLTFFFEYAQWNFVLVVVWSICSLIVDVLSLVLVRRGSVLFANIFTLFLLVLPGYIIFKEWDLWFGDGIRKDSSWDEKEHDVKILLTVTGALATLVRLGLLICTVRCTLAFGGIWNSVFHGAPRPDDISERDSGTSYSQVHP